MMYITAAEFQQIFIPVLEYGAGKSDSENPFRKICFQLVLKLLSSLFTCRVIIESNADLMDFRVFGKIPLNRAEIPAAV